MTALTAIGLGALVVAALGCGTPSSSAEKPAPATGPDDHCTVADECDLVDACCGCNAGGRQIAIRKDAIPAFKASYNERCGGTMCAQFISQDPSCDAEAICGSRGRCRVAPHMKHQ